MIENQIADTIKALSQNGMIVYFVDNAHHALETVKQILPKNGSIGLGGSVTVEECGVIDYLLSKKEYKIFNQYKKGITFEENIKRRRKGILADVYITGTNAITKDGKLVNADGSGNRVAAISYGPKHVIIMVGKNKLVNTLEDAIYRIKHVAAVKNTKRVNEKAASMFKDRSYSVKDIVNIYSIVERCVGEEKKVTIILINQNLGF